MTRENANNTNCHDSTNHPIDPLSRVKEAIINLALWGIVPVKVADWLIQQAGPAYREIRGPESNSQRRVLGRQFSCIRGEASHGLQNCGAGESL